MRAVVVGAGLGGLGTGIHLARQGWDVTILERNPLPGGRMNQIREEGFRIDTGPTLLMMPEVIEQIFASCDRDIRDYIQLERCDPSYEVRFGDGTRLAMGQTEGMQEQFAQFNERDAARFPAMMQDMERRYQLARYRFIERPFNQLGDLLNPQTLDGLRRAMPIRSVWDYVSRFCDDPRLRQALTFQTLYLGTSPYECPSMYGFLPFIEMEYGVWFPRGGMYAIADGLARLFRELGGRLECGVDVERIEVEGGTARGVHTADGRYHTGDVVVSNCDVQTTYTRLIDAEHRPRNTDRRMAARDSGCSGYLLYLGVKRLPENWRHHTVLLPQDYEGVMEDLFVRQCLPREPALYTCVPTCTDPSLAPEGHHILYMLAPAPHLEGAVDWEREAPRFRQQCLDAVRRAGWEGIENDIVFEREWTPIDFQREYGLFRGSAFGLTCTFWQSAYFRPHTRSEDVRNLYLVGASTHPGGGVPIVLTSARLVADTIQSDAARQSRRTLAPWPALRRERVRSGAE